MFVLPQLVTKMRDARGHEHASDGRFGHVAGAHGRHADPRPPSRDPGGRGEHKADAHARTLAQRIKEVPGKLKAQVRTFVTSRYRRLASRYGAAGAKAILAATVLLTPVPMPGTSLIPIALAEVVLAIRRMAGKSYQLPLDDATIRREAKALLAELYEHCGEKMPGGEESKMFRLPQLKSMYDEHKHPRDSHGQWSATGHPAIDSAARAADTRARRAHAIYEAARHYADLHLAGHAKGGDLIRHHMETALHGASDDEVRETAKLMGHFHDRKDHPERIRAALVERAVDRAGAAIRANLGSRPEKSRAEARKRLTDAVYVPAQG